ncbi:MAG: Rrf2 family transcriptional regulator [Phycisphaerae bacterium]
MRISTKGRYGLRAMYELARGFGEGPLLMSAIAERQGLSRKHLHTLLTSLKSAGLVRSIRGPGGGFVLTKVPSEIRLSEVLRALEGPLALVHCVPDRRACDRVNRCAARNVWQKLSGAIEEVLDGVTLEDLVGREAKARSKLGGKK